MENTSSELLKDARKYSLTGKYGGELQGVFQGELYFLSDGKIVGYMYDDGNMSNRKIILGKEDGDYIQYWKMLPLENMEYPIVCNFEKKNNVYKGKWIAFNNLDDYTTMCLDIPEISEAMFATDEEEVRILAGIDNERLEKYLDSGLMIAINKYGSKCSLNLNPLT